MEAVLTKIRGSLKHKAVMSGFEHSESPTARADWNILFRHDGENTLIQSAVAPVYSRSFEQKTFSLDPIAGESYFFRASINAVSIEKTESGRRKEVRCDPEVWLQFQQAKRGFAIEKLLSAVSAPIVETSGGRRFFVNRFHIEGVLIAENAQLLGKTLLKGLGKSRSYGCGLLSILPITQS
jgi:CRISPR system Cascade subunit CasE